MSLPETFETPHEYFEEAVQFFREYQHLYNFPNTKLLLTDCLDRIDLDGLDKFDVFESGTTLEAIADKNLSIRRLLDRISRLSVDYGSFVSKDDLESMVDAPMGVKKMHEVTYLVNEIQDFCEETGCDTVVDFGSGLGYLDELLFAKSNFNVLGLEGSSDKQARAQERQMKYHENSSRKVKYITHVITEHSDEHIKEYLAKEFSDQKGFCITGLHVCADLPIHAINLFLKMADAKSIILLSCCYNRMACDTLGDKQKFKNFPVSHTLKGLYEKYKGYKFLKVPFLRLATQPPRTAECLRDLVFNLLARCVIELYTERNYCILKRRHRKAVKTKKIENDFESYINQACKGFELSCKYLLCSSKIENTRPRKCECELKFDFEELRNLWREFSNECTFKKAAIFILIQLHLQPVFENFVLYDRLVYVKEQGLANCKIKKILNEAVSPRCFALLASK